VHAQLLRQGEQVSAELVRELMRGLGLVSCQPRPYRPTTTSPGDSGSIPDLVNRDFTAEAPGRKMVSDITYIPTKEGWLYLAMVIDCCTRACIGYAMADHLRTELVIDALHMVARNYPLAQGAVFTPTAELNIPVRPSRRRPTFSVSGGRSGLQGYVSIIPSLSPSTLP
jgi:putative transposase